MLPGGVRSSLRLLRNTAAAATTAGAGADDRVATPSVDAGIAAP